MILEIDMGNTWSKWRLRDGQQIVVRGKTLSVDFPQQDLLSLAGVHCVRVASVLPSSAMLHILSVLTATFGNDVQCAESMLSKAGVTNSYQNPSSMGVDRWLAMLAAFNYPLIPTSSIHTTQMSKAKHGCLVVSCGTAVTIDLVRDNGIHEGGYILPGLMMMRDALLTRTGRIQYIAGQFDMSRMLGNSTAEAVEHGAVHAVLSAVEKTYQEANQRWGHCAFFVTGGDALVLSEQLNLPYQYIEELVLDGLQYALP